MKTTQSYNRSGYRLYNIYNNPDGTLYYKLVAVLKFKL